MVILRLRIRGRRVSGVDHNALESFVVDRGHIAKESSGLLCFILLSFLSDSLNLLDAV